MRHASVAREELALGSPSVHGHNVVRRGECIQMVAKLAEPLDLLCLIPRPVVHAGDAWQPVRQYGFAHLEWTTQLG